jgi:hypothetical protein
VNTCVLNQLHIRRLDTESDVANVEQWPSNDASNEEIDNVDAALDSLQMSLEGQDTKKPADVTVYPELKDYHMFLKYVFHEILFAFVIFVESCEGLPFDLT